jgi:hypothetical protein
VKRSLGQRVSFYWWMSAEWAARDEQPILPTSTNPCIPRAAATQGVKTRNIKIIFYHIVPNRSTLWQWILSVNVYK